MCKDVKKENTGLKAWSEDTENTGNRIYASSVSPKVQRWMISWDLWGISSHTSGVKQISLLLLRLTAVIVGQSRITSEPRDQGRSWFQDKMKILKLSRERKEPLQYKVTQVYIYPDFSAGLVQRRRGFDTIKKKLRDQDIKYALISPCMLKVVHTGKTLLILTPEEAEIFLDELSFNSSIDSDMKA